MLGAEKFSANGGDYWEDYKGRVTELHFFDHAKLAAQLADERVWRVRPALDTTGLVGSFRMVQPTNGLTCDDLLASRCFAVSRYPEPEPLWSLDNPYP
jgi:hypothetical protein